jgi:hypothetical protein
MFVALHGGRSSMNARRERARTAFTHGSMQAMKAIESSAELQEALVAAVSLSDSTSMLIQEVDYS